MWVEFLLACIVLAGIVYVPGCLFLKSFRSDWLTSIVCAPVFTIPVYSMLGVVYAQIGVAASMATLVVPLVVLEVVIFGCSLARGTVRFAASLRAGQQRRPITRSAWFGLFCYVLVAAILAFFYYVQTLDGAWSFAQDSDNSWLLALIQSFSQSGNASMLDATLYHDLEGLGLTTLVPVTGSFYPAAWHILAALDVMALQVPVSLAANAVNCLFIILVFPSSMFLFLRTLFEKHSWLLVCLGSIICLGFVAFPWGMLLSVSGPLFPNLAGFSLVPLCCTFFIRLCRGGSRRRMAMLAILLVFGLMALVVLHANAAFTTALILIPFCVYQIFLRIMNSGLRSSIKPWYAVAGCLAFLVGVAVIWYLLYTTPYLQSTVHYNWASYASIRQELVNIVTLGFRVPAAQISLAILVFIGVLYTLYERRYLWLTVSYAVICAFCFVGATTDGALKSFLTGFWYTDPYRLAAMAALIGLPLATLGLYILLQAVKKISTRMVAPEKSKSLITILSVALVIGFIAVNYYPSYTLPGRGNVVTAFGDYETCNILANLQDRDNLYDREEAAFAGKVKDVVDPAYCIYNNADDGSPFAYAFEGLNLCYRRSAAQLLDGGESVQSELLRNRIDDLASDDEVQKVIKDANIRYILILDLGGEITDERCFYGYYTPSKWTGINNIDDETPGLKTLLAEGDMRLYEILPVN